uniref:TEPSIN adaptor related protein complex 4 accessory protein n=1 Tax=Amphilophus citrinellus TaxID=61819 RepID=A0A3Q0QY16_AMPCI
SAALTPRDRQLKCQTTISSTLLKVPTLMKATADDENPCPGYIFQEIGKISHESSGCGQCLLEYLLERLQVESCHVKLKVLKIFVHLCGHGSNHFLTELRRNSTFIQQASVYSGPPDPIHGTALYEKVRSTAQVRHSLCSNQMFIKISFSSCVFTSTVTKWCPGQVGGGWEETDSGNSSSHNSSQDIAANSRASVGSKSAGTGSQSGASRESSADLSDRVEALQLGDCGQEMALINKLTVGSKVFLSREESQHFIKECSILNCEVVVELLSCKLQDPSYTRALCAVACLMTSDLLSLEQMFGATQLRLHQLSEGPPGPVANKATKILRQFEALMGGSQHATRQDAMNSSHQATVTQLHTSTNNLLPKHLDDNFNLHQPDISSAGVTQPPKHPSPLPNQDLAQRHSTQELVNVRKEEEFSPLQQELVEDQVQPVRTAEVKLDAEDPELVRDKSTPALCEPHSNPRHQSRLSLFNGMELVTKGRLLCEREPSHGEVEDKTDDSIREIQTVYSSDLSVNSSSAVTNKTSEDASSVCSSSASNCSQSVSAFSFLNF